jgi:hypothetical protein
VTASNVVGTVTSSSYAVTSSNVTGQSNCNQYALNNGYSNVYSSSITASANDNGRLMIFTTGSLCYLTGSLSSTFSTTIFQSGSSQIRVTGSDASVIIRNRQSQFSTAGQYAFISIIRMPDNSFAVGGDTG